MRKRETTRTIPNRGSYFHVELDDLGRHDFKLPPPTKHAAIIDQMTSPEMRDLAKRARELGEKESKAVTLQESMSTMCSLQGALIGVCWHHVDSDLESSWDYSGESLTDYGSSVFEELWAADYTQADIVILWSACYKQILDSFMEQKELMDAAGFFRAPAPRGGSGCTSASCTCKTHGDGGLSDQTSEKN